jgi:hypothetical protein
VGRAGVLGPPTADSATINALYRTRARRAHPDARGSHVAMAARLNQARDSALTELAAKQVAYSQ